MPQGDGFVYEFVVNARARMAWLLGIVLAGLAIHTAGFGAFEDLYQRSVGVGLAAIILLLSTPLGGRRNGSPSENILLAAIDLGLVVAMVIATAWFFFVHDELETGLYDLARDDIIVGFAGMIVLLELARRTMGMPLLVLGIGSLIYCLFGESLPWIFTHAGYGLEETLRTMWYSFDGVFGLPVAVVANMIAVFVVFGVVLEGTGAGALLLKIAFSLTGHLRGGPAHAAVVSSGLFGTISGSTVGNVVGTGVFTMPMISKRGFPKSFAGAVEAAASTGGQFMPPVMGAVAFIMADLTGVPYLTICAAALIPSVFYYGSLFCAVSVEAVRRGIRPIPPEEREKVTRAEWIQSLTFFLPIVVILGVLIMGRSPATAGFWATFTGIVTGFVLNENLRRNPAVLIETLAKAGKTVSVIMVAVGTIGIIIGTMNLTGLGLRFSALVLSFSGESLFVALLLLMAGSLVLGMGLPTVPAYLIIVLVMGPAIQKLGVEPLFVHLFVMYFGVLSSITPPVAIAAYAAAPICGANPIAVATTSVRIALIGFIIPFIVIYNPSLVLVREFAWADFIWIMLRLATAIWLFTTALSGFDRRALPIWDRALRLAAGIAALIPGLTTEIAGFGAGLALILFHRFNRGINHASPQT